jgi:hypothetical protein
MDTEDKFREMVSMLTFNCTSLPATVAERALISAMRDMAKKTKILRHELTVTGLADCVDTFDFKDQLPEGFTPCAWEIVWYCNCKLKHIDKCDPCPHGYEYINSTCIKLYPTPSCLEDGDLRICMIMVPGFDMCYMPEELCEYEECLIAGATAKVMMQPKKAWTDIRAARLFQREFRAELTNIASMVHRNFTEDACRMEHGFI